MARGITIRIRRQLHDVQHTNNNGTVIRAQQIHLFDVRRRTPLSAPDLRFVKGRFEVIPVRQRRPLYRKCIKDLLQRRRGKLAVASKQQVNGLVYKSVPKYFNVITPVRTMTTLAIEILTPKGDIECIETVRCCVAPISKTLNDILNQNAERMTRNHNTVRNSPVGVMVPAGSRIGQRGASTCYVGTHMCQGDVIARTKRHLLRYGFHNVIDRIADATPNNAAPEEFGRDPFTAFLVTTKNLCNEAHCDPKDVSPSVATWHDGDVNHPCQNWYFLMPNVRLKEIDGRRTESMKGTAIKLSHGTIIQWNGRVIRHCTSLTETISTGCAYSTFFCANRETSKTVDSTAKHDYVV